MVQTGVLWQTGQGHNDDGETEAQSWTVTQTPGAAQRGAECSGLDSAGPEYKSLPGCLTLAPGTRQKPAGVSTEAIGMSYFGEHFWGEKNHGFDVLYQSMKQGPVSTKELADFIRERATIEETYSKAMAKLSKLASNGTPMGTFAPLWEVFRVSSDKLALCHLELTRKLQDLIKDVLRYGEEQLKAHKKCKEEAVGTLDAVQVLAGVSQLLPKSRENYLNRCMDQERLRRESTNQKEMDKAETKTKKAAESLRRSVEKYNSARADFEQKMLDSALRFQALEETHLRHMKALLGSYAHSVENTHVQIGQVHEEFKQNIENVSVEMLLRKFAESKGTGREKPGEPGAAPPLSSAMKRLRAAKAFRLPGLSRREREPPAAADALEPGSGTCAEVDEEGFTVRPDVTQNSTAEPSRCSSSDSDFDDDSSVCKGPEVGGGLETTGLSPLVPSGPSCAEKLQSDEQVSKNLFGPPLEAAFDHEDFTGSSSLGFTSSPSPFSSSSPENVEDSGLDSPSHAAPGPSPDSWAPCPGTPQSPAGCRAPPPESRGTRPVQPSDSPQPLAPSPGPWGLEAVAGGDLMPAPGELTARDGLAAPPRRARSRKVSCPLARSSGDLSRSLSPSPLGSSAPSTVPERPSFSSQTGHGVSRGPSPVVLGSQDALPVATAFTEYVHAYFRGHSPSCLARVTGELTMTFPAGIVRVFSGTPPPPVLSFRLPRGDGAGTPGSQCSLQGRPDQASLDARNLEEKRLLWKLPDVSEAGGSGCLSASWEPCSGPSTPSPVAAQFTSEGATLSGVDLELVGSGYRMSLVKRRFATGMYLVSC
nr:PREDICTED: FCH domain only protein 1 [Equus przewalskii]